MGLDPNQLSQGLLRAIHREPVYTRPAPETAPGGVVAQKTAQQPTLHENHAHGQIQDTQQRQCPQSLAGGGEGEAQSPGLPLVCFTLRRVSLLDVDAKWASVKDLLDGLRYAGLIRGDKEGEIRLEVRQERVRKKIDEETIIEVDVDCELSV